MRRLGVQAQQLPAGDVERVVGGRSAAEHLLPVRLVALAALAPLVVSGRRRGLRGELAVERVVAVAVVGGGAVAGDEAEQARAVDVAEVEHAVEALALHPRHDRARRRAAVGAVADRPQQRPVARARRHVRAVRRADRRLRAPWRPEVRRRPRARARRGRRADASSAQTVAAYDRWMEREPLEGIGAADAHLGRRVPLPTAAAAARALGRGRHRGARGGAGRVEPRRHAARARPGRVALYAGHGRPPTAGCRRRPRVGRFAYRRAPLEEAEAGAAPGAGAGVGARRAAPAAHRPGPVGARRARRDRRLDRL